MYVHVFAISIFPMAINAFVALCTSLSSFLQNMRYSTICSFYNGHFQAILHKTKIYKNIQNTKKYQTFHNLQLLQQTLPNDFTKYKKYKYSTICSFYNEHFQAILQNTKKYKKSIICSFYNGHFQAILQNTKKVQIFHNLQLL